jgi:selenocysteine lyase/cysteine desulfurase
MGLPEPYLREFSEPPGFMDHASISPVSQRVRRAVADSMAGVAAPTGKIGSAVVGAYEKALSSMARFVGTRPERVTVTPSTSAGIFATAFGMLGADGNVVVAAHDFPGVIYPFLRAETVGGPEVRLVDVPGRRLTPDAIAGAIDAHTRAIAISTVDFRTGFRVDVDQVREVAPRAILLVDAIQSLGALRTTLGSADVLVAAGHKWMRAGFGGGVLAVSDRALDLVEPTLTGWWGVEDAFDFDAPLPHEDRPDAERFHMGAPPHFGAEAFAAAVEVIDIAGIDVIETAVRDNAHVAEDVLRVSGALVDTPWRNDAERAGIVSFRMPDEDPAVTHARLLEAGVICTRYGQAVRLAPHATTGARSFELLAEAL